MTPYTVRIIRTKEIARGTKEFVLEKPAGFSFKAGQYVSVRLPHPAETDAKGASREFSLASAPHETELLIAMRMRDTAFKRVLGAAPAGSIVELEGPYGSFTLQNDATRPAVFLIGGIGITPVRSILLRAAKEKLSHKLVLFYSNRHPEDAPFLEELAALPRQNPNFTFIPTMTEAGKSAEAWKGERGRIDAAMLRRYLPDIHAPIYYLVGPAGMVAAMRKLLEDLHVDGDFIKTEEFPGY